MTKRTRNRQPLVARPIINLTDDQKAAMEDLSTNLLRMIANPTEKALERGDIDWPMVFYAREILESR